MKLWFKIFLITLILFLISFYSGIFFLSDIVYKASLDTVRDQAFAQHNFILNTLTSDLSSRLRIENNMSKAINSIMGYYSEYYENRGVQLELLQADNTVFGSISDLKAREQLNDITESRKSVISTHDGNKYIYVYGHMSGQFSDYTLIYSRDITDIVQAQQSLTDRLIFFGIVITLVFIVMLYIVLNRLMNPIRLLQKVSEQIAAGKYEARAKIKGNDEIALLSSRFNKMADEVVSKMEEEQQISLQKQQFIDNLAHELRTPLTTIYGYAEFLQCANSSDDERINATNHIMQQVKRMQTMSEKLLDLSITRRSTIDMREIELTSCFERIHEMLLPRLEQKQLNLEISCKSQFLLGDEILIEQLLLNFLDNSIKASPEFGTISLNAYGQDSVTIEIEDNGYGIEKQQLKRIFEPFYRVDIARSREHGGAGLGLSLCKQIADVHNAKISIQSQIGQGTKISLIFTT